MFLVINISFIEYHMILILPDVIKQFDNLSMDFFFVWRNFLFYFYHFWTWFYNLGMSALNLKFTWKLVQGLFAVGYTFVVDFPLLYFKYFLGRKLLVYRISQKYLKLVEIFVSSVEPVTLMFWYKYQMHLASKAVDFTRIRVLDEFFKPH